jgi:hypothetical protein
MAPKKAAADMATNLLNWKIGKALFQFDASTKLLGAKNWVDWQERVLRALRAIGYTPQSEVEEDSTKGKGSDDDVKVEVDKAEQRPGGTAAAKIAQPSGQETVFPRGNMTESDRLVFGAILVDCVQQDIQGAVNRIYNGDEMMTILNVTYGQPMDQYRLARLQELYQEVRPTGWSEEETQKYVNQFRKSYMECRQAGVSVVASVNEVLWAFVERVSPYYPDWTIRQQSRLLEEEKIPFESLALDLVRFSRISQANRKSAKERRKQPRGTALNTQETQQKGQQNGQKYEFECWKCGKKGHKKNNCPQGKVDSESKDKPQKQESARHVLSMMVVAEANEWIFDTGADVNVCNNLAWFDQGISQEGVVQGMRTAGKMVKPLGAGTVTLKVVNPRSRKDWIYLELRNVQYWPGCPMNLVAGEKLRKLGG